VDSQQPIAKMKVPVRVYLSSKANFGTVFLKELGRCIPSVILRICK
jgi:hypothetical protein